VARYEREATLASEESKADYLRRWAEDERRFAEKADPSRLWGNYGDNQFCGLSCGYNWALHRIRRETDVNEAIKQIRKETEVNEKR
jgi:hypothetical protein